MRGQSPLFMQPHATPLWDLISTPTLTPISTPYYPLKYP